MRVGFIGLGTQGKHLALNLAHAGHRLVVFDLRRQPMEELAAAGAAIAGSPREAGAASEVVEICVVDDAQVESVVLGGDGVLSGAAPGTIIAIHSTIRPATIARIAQAAATRGIEIVDAPVSGGEAGARRKTMSYMVGGSDAAVEKCMALFGTSGSNITRTGPLGTGMRAKLAHQVIICINILAAYEGMRLGIKAGLSPEVLQKIVHEGGAQSRIADRWFEMSLRPHATALFRKDLELGLEFARELGIELRGGALARDLIDEIVP
jgi:3-hydroxyisobutyrate dehydrogenase-like beta-hydroxyacid dehydrogenase